MPKQPVPIQISLKDNSLPEKIRQLMKEGNVGSINYCDNELEFFYGLA